jgi:hypothetical protein
MQTRHEIEGWNIIPYGRRDEPDRIMVAFEIADGERLKVLLTPERARLFSEALRFVAEDSDESDGLVPS